jgi:hypothetical protein
MSAGWHDQLPAGVSRNGWAQVVGSLRLAGCGDVVVLPFHGHQCRASDALQSHSLIPGAERPARERALKIDVAQDVDKDFGGKVHHGRIEIKEWEAYRISAVVGKHLSKELAAFSQVTG